MFVIHLLNSFVETPLIKKRSLNFGVGIRRYYDAGDDDDDDCNKSTLKSTTIKESNHSNETKVFADF